MLTYKSPVSVVVPWHNWPEFGVTSKKNAPLFNAIGAEVIIVNCGGDTQQLAEMIESSRIAHIRQIDTEECCFNRSYALNLGLHCARSARVLMLDADIFFEGEELAALLAALTENVFVTVSRVVDATHVLQPAWVHTGNMYLKEVTRTTYTEFVWGDDGRTAIQTYRFNITDRSRAGSGLVLAARRHFLDVGGFRSSFIGWGFEDLDLHVRLQRVLGLSHVQAGSVFHVPHTSSDKSRGATTRAITNDQNFQRACQLYADGDFHGTYSSDVVRYTSHVHGRSRQ